MKIILPINQANDQGQVNPNFGRSPYYLIYDSSTGEGVYESNAAANSQGGAGIQAAQFCANLKPDAVIAPRLGKNASDVLRAAKIQVCQSQGSSVEENLTKCLEGSLEDLSDVHAGFHRNHAPGAGSGQGRG